MRKAYTDLAKYYDLLFQDKDYNKESDFIKSIIKNRAPSNNSILDIGCGTGTHLNLLLDNFNLLSGLDINPSVLKVAKKKSPKVKYVVGSMKDFNINRKFDVVICLFSVFNYNLTNIEAKKSLRNIKSHLNQNGLVIFALYTPQNTEKVTRLHIGKSSQVEVAKINQFRFNPRTRLETSSYLVLLKDKEKIDFITETDHKYRIFTVKEFSTILKEVGFRKIKVFDNFTDKPASSKTKYPVFVANLK